MGVTKRALLLIGPSWDVAELSTPSGQGMNIYFLNIPNFPLFSLIDPWGFHKIKAEIISRFNKRNEFRLILLDRITIVFYYLSLDHGCTQTVDEELVSCV